MINYRDNDRGGFRGERRSFGGDRGERRGGFGGGRSFGGRPEMHSATCAKCNEQCQVPFRPSGDKPVYCSKCFENNGNSSSGFSSRGRDSRPAQSSSAGISSEQFKQLNAKLDKIISILNSLEVASDEIDEDEDEDSEEDVSEDDEENEDKKSIKGSLDEEDDSDDEEDVEDTNLG